jgi:hypothetical protein
MGISRIRNEPLTEEYCSYEMKEKGRERRSHTPEKEKWWKCGNILNKKMVKENKRKITVELEKQRRKKKRKKGRNSQ